MSNLPNIDDFKSFKMELNDSVNYSIVKSVDIDLQTFYLKLKASRNELKETNLSRDCITLNCLEYKLFNLEFLRSLNKNKNLSHIFYKYMGYSKKYDSLTISVFDEFNKVQTIAIRTAKDKERNLVKWKSYGLKSYVPYKLDYEDNFVFFAVGMAEYLLFELLEVNYILLQSDSMYRYISPELINKMKDKQIIIFKENDESFEKLIVKIYEIFVESNIFIIDFEKVLNKKLSKGYDLRDFCNEIKNIGTVEQLIELEIEKQIKKGSKMIITNWVSLVLADLTKVDEYKALYDEANKSRQLGVVPAFYKEKLNHLREIESVRLFEVEKEKLDEILKTSKSLEDYPNLLGTTKLLIEDDNGYSIYDDYPKFKKGLYSAIESDVMVIYDDIERNIEGRFDWMKDNEI